MKLVIDIDENVYTRLFDNGGDDESDIAKVCAAVRGGVPFLEQHGKLIDADAVITKAIEDKEYEALELAIKALEQQPILDKENMKRLEAFDLGYKHGYELGFTDGVKECAKTWLEEGMQNDE